MKVKRVRSEPGGLVDLEFTEEGCTAQVQQARVLREMRGTAVELVLDDGSTRRYLRTRDGLVQPFQRLLGERLVHSA